MGWSSLILSIGAIVQCTHYTTVHVIPVLSADSELNTIVRKCRLYSSQVQELSQDCLPLCPLEINPVFGTK
jgi:hypothetical protein